MGWVEEVAGVNAQERSRKELLASLRANLAESLEFNRNEAREQLKVVFKKSTRPYEAARAGVPPQ